MFVGIILGALFGSILTVFENYQASFYQRNLLIVPMTPVIEEFEVTIETKIEDEPLHEAARIEEFPPFGHARSPVARVPNWGDMRTPDEWNRNYKQMSDGDFVSVPSYNLKTLTTPMSELLADRETNIAAITAKLYYSTRYFGTYNLDAGEFSGSHPGIDLKLAMGTPVGAIGGGRVLSVNSDQNLGLHVIIEHRIPFEGTFYSIYGHLGRVSVEEGDDVASGTIIGTVGMTGKTTAPHVHLQVDRGAKGAHTRYWPQTPPSRSEARQNTVNPIHFISRHSA